MDTSTRCAGGPALVTAAVGAAVVLALALRRSGSDGNG